MKKIFLTLAVATTLFSCSDFLDQPNEDFSNNPGTDILSPAQRLATAQLNLLNTEVISYNSFGNKMSYAYGLNSGFTSSDVAYNYNFTSASYEALFENMFLYTDNFQDILDISAQFPNYGNHYAIAKIMKVQGMEKLISLYGDVPFSEAFKNSISQPKYDDDKQIVQNLFTLLDEAREEIYAATATTIVPGSEDIMFSGAMEEWIKYANTLELRMLVRLSKTTDATLSALRTQRFANLEQNFIDADVAFNPGFTGATAGQSNPMFRVYGTNVAQTAWLSGNRANAAGIFIAGVVNGTSNTSTLTTGLVDPRRTRMFATISGTVVGATQGTETATAKSRLSSFVHGYTQATANGDAYANGTERDAYAMLAAESFFLQAEAIQRGYMAGDAQSMFEQGVTASFAFYSRGFGDLTGLLAPLNATSYLAAVSAKNGLGWAGSTDKINCIITQKYLALAQWTGIEPYFDMLRTGYPVAPLPQGVSQTSRPNRLVYPGSEYSSNSANVPSITQADLFSNNAKTPFYLQ